MALKGIWAGAPLRKNQLLLMAGTSVVLGVAVVWAIFAAGMVISVEPETGSLAGGSSVVSDAGASGGQAVQFGGASSPTPGPSPSGWWKPSSSAPISWNWVIGVTPPTPYANVQVYDIDGFENTSATVSSMHASGKKVICYIDVGTYEPNRPDDNLIPAADMGADVQGWPGEKWLNIADISGLTPMLQDRMNMCKSKGFDAIEPDNLDGYTNPSGFPLTAANELAFCEFIANMAHGMGLSIGLKNDVDQAAQLVPYFDWSLNEECNLYGECNTEAPFVNAGKAVFNAEYSDDGETTAKFCAADAAAHMNGVLYKLSLDGTTFQPCTGTW